MLRASTFNIAQTHLKLHLEADWKDIPIEHITIDAVNEWTQKKRAAGLSWVTVKNILRTMQRVLSAYSKGAPPFSQTGLRTPERDKLQMKIKSREAVSFSWQDALRIASAIRKLDIAPARGEQFATLVILAAASGLRCSELFALKVDDIDFKAGTIRVDESSDQRSAGKLGPCKNVAAYRTVGLHDDEGKKALHVLKAYLKKSKGRTELIFQSRNGTPLLETNVLKDGLYPALKVLVLPKAGMHAFRHGCNRRWELSGLNSAVIRQQMGHSSATMTARYTGQIPLEQVLAAYSSVPKKSKKAELEILETEAAA
jgi:integrase